MYRKPKIAFLGIILAALLSAVVMILWNLLMPVIFGLKTINFWQAAGIFILSRILFGSFWGIRPWYRNNPVHHNYNHLRDKWMNMSEEERREFINKRRKFFQGAHFDHGDVCTGRTHHSEKNDTTGKGK